MRDEVESPGELCWASAIEVGISTRATLSVEYRIQDDSDDELCGRSTMLDCLSGTWLVDDCIFSGLSCVLSKMWKEMMVSRGKRFKLRNRGCSHVSEQCSDKSRSSWRPDVDVSVDDSRRSELVDSNSVDVGQRCCCCCWSIGSVEKKAGRV